MARAYLRLRKAVRQYGWMLSADERDELISLRERVYGPSSEQPTDEALLRRLLLLESRQRGNAFAAEPTSDPHKLSEEQLVPEVNIERPRSQRRHVVFSVSIGLAGGLAFVGGLVVGQHNSGDSAETASLPELEWVQTDEDVEPLQGIAGAASVLEPSTVRYVGTVEGVALYIGYQVTTSNVCVAAYPPDPQEWFTGCGTFGVTSQVRENFLVHVGPPDPGALIDFDPNLRPHQLSASVTAFFPD